MNDRGPPKRSTTFRRYMTPRPVPIKRARGTQAK